MQKLQKFINLALKNANENEARIAAKQFFKRLEREGIKFKPSLFNLTAEEGFKLYSLGHDMTRDEELIEEMRKRKAQREAKAETKAEPKNDDQFRPHHLNDILNTIEAEHGVVIPASKARATLRRKMANYPGTKFTDDEVGEAELILRNSFC